MLTKAFDVALKVAGLVIKVLGSLSYKIDDAAKRKKCTAHDQAKLYKSCRIMNGSRDRSRINIGKGTHVYGDLLVLGHSGRIDIGTYSFISEGTRVWSGAHVTIGDRVLISHNVEIHDSNSHSLSAASRHVHFRQISTSGHPTVLEDVDESPVIICDDAWICFGATILKGVSVGEGSVVAARAVVTKDVPPYTIVAGNPARPIGATRR